MSSVVATAMYLGYKAAADTTQDTNVALYPIVHSVHEESVCKCYTVDNMVQRTASQNNSIHRWFALKAEQCRDAGVTTQMALNKTIELDMSPEMMKEIWRVVQKALYKKHSTTELSKSTMEIDNIAEHLNRFFAEKFGLPGIEIPNDPTKLPSSPGFHDKISS